MNKCSFIGRITRDPEVKKTPNGVSVCSFTVAVDRRFKDSNGNKQTDFIPCVGWKNVAEIIGNYFSKGSRIGISGCIQTRSYDDQHGQKRNVVEVLVEEIDFLDQKKADPDTEIRPIPPMPKAEQIEEPEENLDQLPFDVFGI